jgi:hypothetical protein
MIVETLESTKEWIGTTFVADPLSFVICLDLVPIMFEKLSGYLGPVIQNLKSTLSFLPFYS